MQFRQVRYRTSLARILYAALEAKYYGELAPGVGEQTDRLVWHQGQEPVVISKRSQKALFKIAHQLLPRPFKNAISKR